MIKVILFIVTTLLLTSCGEKEKSIPTTLVSTTKVERSEIKTLQRFVGGMVVVKTTDSMIYELSDNQIFIKGPMSEAKTLLKKTIFFNKFEDDINRPDSVIFFTAY